jgi:hypothetical protein
LANYKLQLVTFCFHLIPGHLKIWQVVCGKRAGAFTCLLDETGRYGPYDSLPEEVKPDFKVSSLTEVFAVLEEHFDLAPVPAESRI